MTKTEQYNLEEFAAWAQRVAGGKRPIDIEKASLRVHGYDGRLGRGVPNRLLRAEKYYSRRPDEESVIKFAEALGVDPREGLRILGFYIDDQAAAEKLSGEAMAFAKMFDNLEPEQKRTYMAALQAISDLKG